MSKYKYYFKNIDGLRKSLLQIIEGRRWMNIRYALEYAEQFLIKGDKESAKRLISYAEEYLRVCDPEGTIKTAAICCFVMEKNTIHCGSLKEPLLPGTFEERVKLCGDCRQWCRQKINELKQKASP